MPGTGRQTKPPRRSPLIDLEREIRSAAPRLADDATPAEIFLGRRFDAGRQASRQGEQRIWTKLER